MFQLVKMLFTSAIGVACLLLATSTVLSERGNHGVGHDKLHNWYKTLRQPRTGYACCDGKDCRPTVHRVRSEAIEVLVDGEWTRVPDNTIINLPSPDLHTHVCAPKGPWSPKPIFCVVLGSGV